MSEEFDSLNRRKRTRPVSTHKRVTPRARDLVWFEKLREHGPLPTSFLLKYAKKTHRSEKRAKERLTDLFNEDLTPHGGTYLTRPLQQFRTLDSRYNQLVYDLAPPGAMALKTAGRWKKQSSVRAGPWLHGFMVSCITASIELATLEREDVVYIPQSKILERAQADLRFPTTIIDPNTKRTLEKTLIPDGLFGLEYVTDSGSRFRFFLVEADRSTEPATSENFNRKSILRSFLQYDAYVGKQLYRDHLKLTAPLLILSVSSNEKRLEQLVRLASSQVPEIRSNLLFQTWDNFGTVFRPPNPNFGLLNGDWARADGSRFWADRP